jgi:hypothetical protein
MVQLGEDKRQIGLTPVGQASIELIYTDNELFASETDAYKFGVTYAIAVGLDPDDAPAGGYNTKFNAIGTLDVDGVLREILDVLAIGDPARPYATAEKLAELGLTAIAERLAGNETLADIIADVAQM